MSEFTATGYRDRILGYATDHGHEIGTSKAMRLAVKLCKRQARMTDLELERILTHSDPTPKQAFRNLEEREAAAVANVMAQRPEVAA